jgi:hypothetical protein
MLPSVVLNWNDVVVQQAVLQNDADASEMTYHVQLCVLVMLSADNENCYLHFDGLFNIPGSFEKLI